MKNVLSLRIQMHMTTSAPSENEIQQFLRKAIDSADQGNRPLELAYHLSAALLGDWDSWLSIALIIDELSQDKELSMVFRKKYLESLNKEAEAGDLKARRRLAGLYEFGQSGFSANPEYALQILIENAENNDPISQFELFEKYLYGLSSAEVDKEKAIFWLNAASKNGHLEASQWITRFSNWEKENFEYPRPTRKKGDNQKM